MEFIKPRKLREIIIYLILLPECLGNKRILNSIKKSEIFHGISVVYPWLTITKFYTAQTSVVWLVSHIIKKNSEEIAAQISLVHNCKMKRT